MPFKLTILGSSSATPTSQRYPSAQVLQVPGRLFLIDCGEGTQMQLRRYRIRFQRISHIFISHLHGDHYLGLMGLLFTFHLLGRKDKLHVFGHPELEKIINIQLNVSKTKLLYPLEFHPFLSKETELIWEDKHLTVKAVPMRHRIPTSGFLIKEKNKERNISKDFLLEEDVEIEQIKAIKKGADFVANDGKKISNSEITSDPPFPSSYAYFSDTSYIPSAAKEIMDCGMLYHEATFMEDMRRDAEKKFHSTAKQAAEMAKLANAEQLLLGHFSARYDDLDLLLEEARMVFPNSRLAEEGKEYDL